MPVKMCIPHMYVRRVSIPYDRDFNLETRPSCTDSISCSPVTKSLLSLACGDKIERCYLVAPKVIATTFINS